MTAFNLKHLPTKRDRILDRLRSDTHYVVTDRLVHGTQDPTRVSIPRCDSCGHQAALDKQLTPEPRWSIVCPNCKKTIPSPQDKPWRAALMWCTRNIASMHYRELPLFEISELDPSEAQKKIIGIKRNLELRSRIIKIDRVIAQRTGANHPETHQVERLEAFLMWAALALRLIKHAQQTEAIPIARRRAG